MAGIKNCIAKFKEFPESLKNKLISLSDRFKSEGKEDLQADTEAILEVHKELHDELNDLKRQVKQPIKKYVKPDSSKQVEAVQEKFKKEDDAAAQKEAELEKFATMGKEVNPEGMSEEEYLATVLSESTNPAEIAGAWLNEYETDSRVQKNYDEGSGTTEDMIYAFFKNGGKLSKKSFEKEGDRNNMDISGRRTYFAEKGGKDADVAISIDKPNGELEYVAAQAVIDFINDHPTGIGSYESKFDSPASQLHSKFIRITGKRLTPKFAREIFKRYVEIKDKEANTMPPMTAKEASEELSKEAAREEVFAETGQFQKKEKESKADKAVIDKVMERMKKVLPKFNIVYNPELEAAGKIDGNKIEINPLYAGTDTPIHEAGHALIDFIGYKNRVIQAGIKQLRDTQLYKDVAAARPELKGELLDKEVLAEAIGKEGAEIFDTEVKKKRFKQVLDYIYTKLKQLLGIDKNIARSLAKQIIGGVKTKDVDGNVNEAFQKKDGEKKAKKEPLSPEAQKIKDLYDAIKDIEDVSAIPYEDLLSAYNYAITNEEFRKSSGATKAKDEFVERIGANFYQRNYDKAKSDPKFDPMKAAKTDIGGKDILFKALSHFTNNHPELKGLKELYDKAVFKRITETTEKQNTNRKLAIEVIKDRNKSLGIVGRVKENVLNLIFGNRNFKYFDYLEGKDGKFITVDEAKKKKLSEAQINYLKFVRNTVAAKAGVIDNLKDNWNSEMEVLRADKKFYESATTENAVAAVSHLLGNTWNISNVRIDFINPNTGKEQTADYGEIERIFTKYGNESPVKKAKSVASIIKYNVKARKQLKTGTNIDEAANPLNMVKRGDYVLTKEGKLISRFDRKRSETRSYSKDFYSAINEYIADTEHIQHMQPLIPIIHGIDNLNRLGLYERDENGEISKTIHGQKPNLVKWLNEWSNMHIYKNPKETIPELDVALRFFRNVASMTMMLFNTTAQARNAIMGVVNAFIKENGATIKDGMSRLFGSTRRKINSDYAYGLVNPYALELIKKFKAVSTDIDSNPIRSAGGFLTSLGFAGTKWGEFLVQGSQWLGTMSKEDYNSFTWKKNKFGVDELVFKETIPKEKQEEIEARLLDLVNKVSDVQGKYSEKDRRNIQNSEWGKSIMQYRVWLPDWWRVRFSKDAGHWRNMMGGEIWELRKNLAKAAVDKGYAKAIWQDKNMMSALKELMLITGLFALMYQDDDDEEKSFASKQAMKMLSEMVGVVDPENVKQIIERPIPSMGVVTKFLDAADHLIMLEADDFYKKDSKYGKKGDPKVIGDVRGLIPGKQAIDMAEEAIEDEGEK